MDVADEFGSTPSSTRRTVCRSVSTVTVLVARGPTTVGTAAGAEIAGIVDVVGGLLKWGSVFVVGDGDEVIAAGIEGIVEVVGSSE